MEIRELLRLNVGTLLFSEHSRQIAPIAGELDDPGVIASSSDGKRVIVNVTVQTGPRKGKCERRSWLIKNVRLKREGDITLTLT